MGYVDLGIIGDGGAKAPLGSLNRVWDPEVFYMGHGTETGAHGRCRHPEILQSDPEIVVGTQRFLWLLFDPEVA